MHQREKLRQGWLYAALSLIFLVNPSMYNLFIL